MFAKNMILGIGAVGIALLSASAVKATTIADLTSGGSLTVGDLTYSNFTYGSSGTGMVPASNVVVTPTATGLAFTVSTGGWTIPADTSVIAYDVTVTGSTISSVNLDFSATASGGAIASVGETVTDLTNNKDYSLQVVTDGSGPLPDSSSDSVTLTPTTSKIHVVKSIDIAANGGTATITLVDNGYVTSGTGATPPVPEPMSLALLPLALAGLGLRKKFAR